MRLYSTASTLATMMRAELTEPSLLAELHCLSVPAGGAALDSVVVVVVVVAAVVVDVVVVVVVVSVCPRKLGNVPDDPEGIWGVWKISMPLVIAVVLHMAIPKDWLKGRRTSSRMYIAKPRGGRRRPPANCTTEPKRTEATSCVFITFLKFNVAPIGNRMFRGSSYSMTSPSPPGLTTTSASTSIANVRDCGRAREYAI